MLVSQVIGARELPRAADVVGLDFIAFYTAGSLVADGRIANLYDLDTKRDFQRKLAVEIGRNPEAGLAPWWNPPFYAWVFVPFAHLAFVPATVAWTALNILMVGVGLMCLVRSGGLPSGQDLPARPVGSDGWLAALLIVASMPFLGMVSHAQNTGMSFLLLSLTVLAWRTRRGMLAGAMCGLLFYKPQLALLVAGMLVLTLGWRPLLGLGCSGAALLAVTVITLPGALGDFATTMPNNLAYAQQQLVYLWDRHATVKAFWRLLLQGYETGPAWWVVDGLTILCAGGLGALLVMAGMRWRRSGDVAGLDRLIAATIVAMPLIMPFYFDYDLLLLAIPAWLLGRDCLAAGDRPKWLVRAWMVLYVWLYVNAAVAEASRVNGTVLLLSAVAVMMNARVWQRTVRSAVTQPGGTLREPAMQAL